MKEIVSLINTFALLSLLAIGGGAVVIPQMEHETVTLHQWVTGQQFSVIYSLGQLTPGPNMTMVALIGYHAAGITGFFVALLAFYIPSSILVYFAAQVWDHFADNPWRDAVQKGLAPITIGLMLAGAFAIGKSASFNLERPLWFNIITICIGIAVVVILFLRRINPALLMLAGGIIGYFFLRLPPGQ